MHERALQAAREQGDLETEGWAHIGHVWLARSTGQAEMALAHATQGYEIAERIGDAFSRVWAIYYLGYARLMVGEANEAVAAIERSMELGREARTALDFESQRMAALSEALLSAGDWSGIEALARDAAALKKPPAAAEGA